MYIFLPVLLIKYAPVQKTRQYCKLVEKTPLEKFLILFFLNLLNSIFSKEIFLSLKDWWN